MLRLINSAASMVDDEERSEGELLLLVPCSMLMLELIPRLVIWP